MVDHRRSPPQLSRGIARRGGSLLLFLITARRRSSCVFSSVAAPCGARARRAGGDGRRARDARSTRELRAWSITAAAQPGHRAPRRSSPPLPLLSSRPSLRARAAPSLHPRAGGGCAHHERARGRAPSATRRAQRAGSPSAARPRSSWPTVLDVGGVSSFYKAHDCCSVAHARRDPRHTHTTGPRAVTSPTAAPPRPKRAR